MPGHLEKRADKTWTIVLEYGRDPVTNKRKRIKKAFRGNKREAEIELARLLTEIEQGLFCEPSNLTVAEFLRKWLETCARQTVVPSTFHRYEQIIEKKMIPEIGMIRLEKLRPLHIQNYYSRLLSDGRMDKKDGGLSPTTVVQHHRILHRALEMAVRWQMLPRNVADAVDPPRKNRPEITTLTQDQVRILMESASTSIHYPAVVLAVMTGMRRGEIFGLRWRDVNHEQGTITVNQVIQYSPSTGLTVREWPKTSRSRRVVDVSPYVLTILKRVRLDQNKQRLQSGRTYKDSDLIFTQADGSPRCPDNVSSWFPSFCEEMGLPRIRFHDLRHTHASLLLQNGESLKLICDRLGHSGIGITADTYTHLAPGTQSRAAKQLEDMIFSR